MELIKDMVFICYGIFDIKKVFAITYTQEISYQGKRASHSKANTEWYHLHWESKKLNFWERQTVIAVGCRTNVKHGKMEGFWSINSRGPMHSLTTSVSKGQSWEENQPWTFIRAALLTHAHGHAAGKCARSGLCKLNEATIYNISSH